MDVGSEGLIALVSLCCGVYSMQSCLCHASLGIVFIGYAREVYILWLRKEIARLNREYVI
jgi:E3 ubiquitin-protein ligase DOA10